MTTDEVLQQVYDRYLTLYLDDAGVPRIKGPHDQITPELVTLLKENREAIIARLKLPTRRIVLLQNGLQSGVEKVLTQCDPRDHHMLTRKLAEENPGRTVCAEWCVKGRWYRFLVLSFPA